MEHSSPSKSKPQDPQEWLRLSLSEAQPPPAPESQPRDFFEFLLQPQPPSSPTTTSEPPPQDSSSSQATSSASVREPQPQVDVIPEVNLPPLEDQEPQCGPSRPGRARARKSPPPKEGWVEIIDPPYPWATSRRAIVHSLQDLRSKNIRAISGEVLCKHCKNQYTIEYDLESKFSEILAFVAKNKRWMHHRAVKQWSNPVALDCKLCGSGKCVVPVISKKRSTNWLFLLLGQMVGFCKLPHLKYFCKHAKVHRTGAKDRLIYLTYMSLCKQLYPDELFDP